MTDRVMAVLAFVFLLGFLGILLWFVPRLDLGGVIAATLMLVAYDFYSTLRSGPDR
jgi:hypothetical protein